MNNFAALCCSRTVNLVRELNWLESYHPTWHVNPTHGRRVSERVSKLVIIGWMISSAGTALWLYGYFAAGHPSIIDWHARSPWWIADYLANIESEIGMTLAFAGMVPIYWPPRR
jgi:hypothetical protein